MRATEDRAVAAGHSVDLDRWRVTGIAAFGRSRVQVALLDYLDTGTPDAVNGIGLADAMIDLVPEHLRCVVGPDCWCGGEDERCSAGVRYSVGDPATDLPCRFFRDGMPDGAGDQLAEGEHIQDPSQVQPILA